MPSGGAGRQGGDDRSPGDSGVDQAVRDAHDVTCSTCRSSCDCSCSSVVKLGLRATDHPKSLEVQVLNVLMDFDAATALCHAVLL
jgi:hypothetical protein